MNTKKSSNEKGRTSKIVEEKTWLCNFCGFQDNPINVRVCEACTTDRGKPVNSHLIHLHHNVVCHGIDEERPYRCDFCPSSPSFAHLDEWQEHLRTLNHLRYMRAPFPNKQHPMLLALIASTTQIQKLPTTACVCRLHDNMLATQFEHCYHPTDECVVMPSKHPVLVLPATVESKKRRYSCHIVDSQLEMKKKPRQKPQEVDIAKNAPPLTAAEAKAPICGICESNPVKVQSMPCGHDYCCYQCTTRLKDRSCPICRKAISHTQLLHHSPSQNVSSNVNSLRI